MVRRAIKAINRRVYLYAVVNRGKWYTKLSLPLLKLFFLLNRYITNGSMVVGYRTADGNISALVKRRNKSYNILDIGEGDLSAMISILSQPSNVVFEVNDSSETISLSRREARKLKEDFIKIQSALGEKYDMFQTVELRKLLK